MILYFHKISQFPSLKWAHIKLERVVGGMFWKFNVGEFPWNVPFAVCLLLNNLLRNPGWGLVYNRTSISFFIWLRCSSRCDSFASGIWLACEFLLANTILNICSIFWWKSFNLDRIFKLSVSLSKSKGIYFGNFVWVDFSGFWLVNWSVLIRSLLDETFESAGWIWFENDAMHSEKLF